MQGFGPESMAAEFSFTFLGTGTSIGVPVIGCLCEVCRSIDPRNERLRSSALLKVGETTLLIDSGPDLRRQALREGFTAIDAVLYTHEHLDHVVGFDELRAFCWRRDTPLPMHAPAECLETLKRMFGWAFAEDNIHRGYVKPDPRVVDGPFSYGDLVITPLPVDHGSVVTFGYMFETDGKKLAYVPDVKRIPLSTKDLLRDLDGLVVDALRPREHPTHFSTDEALAMIAELRPVRAWLTHLGHENDHSVLEDSLPEGVAVAYDGLRIRF